MPNAHRETMDKRRDVGSRCSWTPPPGYLLEAIAHFKEEAVEKVRTNQARLVLWDDIKDNPPK